MQIIIADINELIICPQTRSLCGCAYLQTNRTQNVTVFKELKITIVTIFNLRHWEMKDFP